MALLPLPANLEADIQSRNTALIPVVRFTDANGSKYNFISTSLIKKGNHTWKPILLSVPSIKESIDIKETNKMFGDAILSEKHCNFLINKEKATSKDMKNLIYFIKENVYKKTGIKLELEIVLNY